ncbi:MAG: polysaccharide deacetylase family protein [Bdellovibrionales bacterium]|jgi:peptidoglycan/xylan/chitin deacetylase (PgdA/CDA1 family)
MVGNRSIIIRSRIHAYLAGTLCLVTRVLVPFLAARDHGKTRVLVFHHLDKAALFDRILRVLARRYHLLSFDDYLQGKKDPARINVIVALDDGYRSWFDIGKPIFAAHGVKPLLFVSSDFIGLEDAAARHYCQERIKTWQEPSLTWEQLAVLAARGAEVGGHSLGHTNMLTALPEERLVLIAQDRLALEGKLGIQVRCFSYPFGLHGSALTKDVEKSGYAYGFTSDSGFLEDSKGPLLLKRTNIGLRPPFVIEAFVEGWGDRISATMRRIKQGNLLRSLTGIRQ